MPPMGATTRPAEAPRAAPMPSKKVIAMDDLMKHNTASDCWIAVRDKVYDVTSWVNKHPGGVDPLVLNGGRDATQLFEAYHPVRVYGTLHKYYVGELDRSEYPTFPPMSDFYIELKAKIEKYFRDRNISPRYAPEMLVRSVLIVLGCFVTHYLSITATSPLLALLFAIAAGVGGAWVCFMPAHEGSHASTTESPLLWRIMGASLDYVLGAAFFTWLHQHFLGHHPFTNVVDPEHPVANAIDPDVSTGKPDARRITDHQEMLPLYRFQVFYAPLIYGLLGMKFRIEDFTLNFRIKTNGVVRVAPMSLWHQVNFWAGKLFWLTYRIALPAYFAGWGRTLTMFVVSDLVTSWILAWVFQVNHVIPQAIFPKVNTATNSVDMDWALMQLATTMDYAHGSWWTTFATGALNHQVVHHLFPYISQIHYPAIAPIIREHCALHGVTYHHLPSFTAAFKNHLAYLAQMGGKAHSH